MKLLPKERLVLGTIEHQADLPISKIQKQTKLRSHTIRYILGKLHDKGLVVGRAPFINSYLIGYTDYTIYFSVNSKLSKSKNTLEQKLINSRSISWVARLGGEFQIGIAICAKHISEAYQLIIDISKEIGPIFYQKSISVRLSFTAFGRKYLLSKPVSTRILSVRRSGKLIQIDDLDHKILSGAANLEYNSNRQLALKLSVPFSTLERRIHSLEKAGLIVGYIYRMNLSQIGAQNYRLLIYSRGINPSLSEALYNFAAKHPHILHLIECLGAWDYEIGIEVYSSEEVNEIIQEIYASFGDSINEIKILQIFKHLKYSGYPFATGDKFSKS